MKLPKLAINNYNFTLVVFVLMLIAGVISFFNMPRTENPSIYIPGTSVVVIYPGASPNDLEQLIAIPIEEAVNELDDIERINTYIRDGIVSVNIEFDFNVVAKEKYDEVVSKINSIKSTLPEEIFDIYTVQWTSTDVEILQLALISESATYSELDKLSERLKKKIEKAYGVKKVEIHAIPEQEVRISINMEKMALMNISLDHVINSIKSYNANIPGGAIKLADKTFNIKTSGPYENLKDIENTVVHSFQGKTVYLKNIADISFKDEDLKYFARFKGKKAVFVTVKQKADLNIFKIMDEINPIIDEYQSGLDENVQLFKVFDQSQTVEKRINNFLSNLSQGVILVGLLILLTIGFKSSLIIIIAIPLSIIMGLAIVDYMGYGMQQISVAGLVIALGLLVDNSIVMIENITRFIKLGHKPKEAAVLGASEIGWPIISATITTILAFIPIIMMPNEAGMFIRSLPVTIIATLTVSLLIALTLSPLIASLTIKAKDFKNKTNKNITNFTSYINKFIEGPYRKTL
ncbi:MAG: efflux RND transporter permease subunit, partial [Bacteroidales bacterium]|nr:efflux RND transporter permease subunit [Bacteroidales bacterium]